MSRLITCSDCGRKVSPRAEACPQCGSPIAARNKGSLPLVRTTEKTGKKWKLWILIGFVIAAIGVVATLIGIIDASSSANHQASPIAVIGCPAACLGIMIMFAARLGAWWNHG